MGMLYSTMYYVDHYISNLFKACFMLPFSHHTYILNTLIKINLNPYLIWSEWRVFKIPLVLLQNIKRIGWSDVCRIRTVYVIFTCPCLYIFQHFISCSLHFFLRPPSISRPLSSASPLFSLMFLCSYSFFLFPFISLCPPYLFPTETTSSLPLFCYILSVQLSPSLSSPLYPKLDVSSLLINGLIGWLI